MKSRIKHCACISAFFFLLLHIQPIAFSTSVSPFSFISPLICSFALFDIPLSVFLFSHERPGAFLFSSIKPLSQHFHLYDLFYSLSRLHTLHRHKVYQQTSIYPLYLPPTPSTSILQTCSLQQKQPPLHGWFGVPLSTFIYLFKHCLFSLVRAPTVVYIRFSEFHSDF